MEKNYYLLQSNLRMDPEIKNDKKLAELIKLSNGYCYTLNKIEHFKDKTKKSLGIFEDSIAKSKLLELVDALWKSTFSLNIK